MLSRFIKLKLLIKNDNLSFLFLILSFILIIYLIYQNYNLRKELFFVNRIAQELNNESINTDQLYNIIKRHLNNPMTEKAFKWNLILIFSPEDCPSCIDEISFLNNYLKQKKLSLGCWGLLIHPFPKLVNDFVNTMGWELPVYILNPGMDNFNLDSYSAPLKILMKKNEYIYYVEGPNPQWYNKSILKNLIDHLPDY